MTLVWILLVVALCLNVTNAKPQPGLELEVEIATASRAEYYAHLTRNNLEV